jgi:hypothetical protein
MQGQAIKMTTEQIKAVHEAKPFRAFTIHLADGTSLEVPHPELFWRTQGGRTVFVNTGGDDVAIVNLLLVTKISLGNGETKRRRR